MPVAPLHTPYRIPPKAMYFDGVNDYVEVPHNDVLSITGDLTVEVIAKFVCPSPSVNMYMGIVSKRVKTEPSAEYGINYNPYKNKLQFYFGDGEHFYILDIPYKVGLYYLVCIRKSGVLYMYRNLEFEGSADYSSYTPVSTTEPVRIGVSMADSEYHIGYIALVRIYNRALSEDEIRYNYYNMDNPVTNGLVLWLDWTSIDEANGVWRDKSGFGNDGVIYGAVPVDIIKR